MQFPDNNLAVGLWGGSEEKKTIGFAVEWRWKRSQKTQIEKDETTETIPRKKEEVGERWNGRGRERVISDSDLCKAKAAIPIPTIPAQLTSLWACFLPSSTLFYYSSSSSSSLI